MKKILMGGAIIIVAGIFFCLTGLCFVESVKSAADMVVFDKPVTMNETLKVKKGMRVDGILWSKKKYKKGDVRVADSLVPAKNDKSNLGKSSKYWKDGYIKNLYVEDIKGEVIDSGNLAPGTVTQTGESYGTATQTTANFLTYDYLTEQVTLTTDESTLFITFSGVLSNNTNDGQSRIILEVDGQPITHSIRRGTSSLSGRTFTLATNSFANVTAGSHTVRVGWNTEYGQTAYMYHCTLDVIELKK